MYGDHNKEGNRLNPKSDEETSSNLKLEKRNMVLDRQKSGVLQALKAHDLSEVRIDRCDQDTAV